MLAEPENPEAWGAAAAMLGSQFENEDVVGPYSEAIASLPDAERTQLIVTAARHEGWMWRSWAFEQMLKVDTTDDPIREQIADVFAAAADTLVTTGSFPDDDVRVHILGIRGWARFVGTERPVTSESHGGGLAWVLVDALIGDLEGVTVDTATVWHRLETECPQLAVDAFHWLSRVDILDREPAHRQILNAFPVEARRLLEWGLEHRGDLRSPFRHRDPLWADQYMVRSLGTVGDARTAEKLQAYRVEPHLAKVVVEAIRRIHERTGGRST